MCWELTWQHLTAAADLSAAHPWCESPAPPHPKVPLLDCILVMMEPFAYSHSHCHVQRNQFEKIWALWHDALSCSHQKMSTEVRKGGTWLTAILSLVGAKGSKCAKKISPHYSNTSSSVNSWYKAVWSVFSCCLLKFWLRPGKLFPVFCCPILVTQY